MTREKIAEYLQELSTAEFALVFCERMDGKSNKWNYSKHNHSYLEIIFFLSGHIVVDASNEQLQLKTYGVLFYPPGVIHQELKNPHINQEVIALGIQSNQPCSLQEAFLTSDTKGIFSFLFNQIYENAYHKGSQSEELKKCYIEALLLNASQKFSDEEQAPFDVVHSVTEYINHHFFQQITLEQVSDLVAVSPSYLIRLFHREMHTTPMQYLAKIRIRTAEGLLRSTSYTIAEIAQKVGYEEASYFWRVFKRYTGYAPSAYRLIEP
ncbi:MAG: helix-turn-helix domain-containing protein [Sphaerochaeta sp.]